MRKISTWYSFSWQQMVYIEPKYNATKPKNRLCYIFSWSLLAGSPRFRVNHVAKLKLRFECTSEWLYVLCGTETLFGCTRAVEYLWRLIYSFRNISLYMCVEMCTFGFFYIVGSARERDQSDVNCEHITQKYRSWSCYLSYRVHWTFHHNTRGYTFYSKEINMNSIYILKWVFKIVMIRI